MAQSMCILMALVKAASSALRWKWLWSDLTIKSKNNQPRSFHLTISSLSACLTLIKASLATTRVRTCQKTWSFLILTHHLTKVSFLKRRKLPAAHPMTQTMNRIDTTGLLSQSLKTWVMKDKTCPRAQVLSPVIPLLSNENIKRQGPPWLALMLSQKVLSY